MYLLEPDDVWMQQGAVVDKLPLNILINLQATNKLERQPTQALLSTHRHYFQY